MAKFKRVAVLMGGLSPEREISLRSGRAISDALKGKGYDVVDIDAGRNLGVELANANVEAAFIALHGTYGEDGCVQGLLENMGLPYTGSGVLACALAMDKAKSKEVFSLYQLPTPRAYSVSKNMLGTLGTMQAEFTFPVFVKPRHGGSSLGAGKANNLEELKTRCEEALKLDNEALIEEFIEGRELTVALYDGKSLGAVEITPTRAFYDYTAKYTVGGSRYSTELSISAEHKKRLFALAEVANLAIGGTSFTRVDFLSTDSEHYVLEVNTVPGFTELSLYPRAAQSAGYDYPAICERILEGAALKQRAYLHPDQNKR